MFFIRSVGSNKLHMSKTVISILFFVVQINLFGQDTTVLTINKDSVELFDTKEKIGRKTFRALTLDYNYFVNPGQEFNTTDLYHPKSPGCRIIICIKDMTNQNYIFYYECGGYHGAQPICIIGVRRKNNYDLFDPIDRIENKTEFMDLIQTGQIKIKPSWRTK